jgi:cytoskeletal protein RodZ
MTRKQQGGRMDELDETEVPTAGERLRAAREGKGLSLEEVAAQTRIPRRHLESLETADWEKLPAPTYTIGFAKSYASAVDLDRNEIGDQLRAEMGGTRATATTAEVFEPADPARTMPKWLVLAAVAAVILVIAVMTWLNNRSLNDDNSSAPAAAASGQPAQQQAPQPAVAQGPVVLSATQAVWLSVKDNGHILKQGTLQPGETYTVPSGATAPMLTTAKAEALKIAVGTTTAAPVGPAATRVTVSLLPADLMKGGTAQTAAPAPTTAAAPASQPTRTRHAAPPARRTTAPPPAAVTPAPVPAAAAPATANTAQ